MRQPIPDDWDGVSWCAWAVCWPDSPLWRGILRGFISSPARGRFWDERTGQITTVQATGQQITAYNFPLQEVILSCSGASDLAAAVRYLADRLADKSCCGSVGTAGGPGTGGTGNTSQPPNDDVTENEPPEGFETWAEFKAYQCAVYTWLLDTIAADLTTMGTLQLVGVTALGLLPTLGALLLDPIPGDELIYVAGVLVGIASYGSTTLSQVRESFNDAKPDMLCGMYNAIGASSAKAAAEQAFGEALDGDTVDPIVRMYGKQLVGYMLSLDAINKAQALDAARTYPAADCSECGYSRVHFFINEGVPLGVLISGTLNADGENTVLESAWDGAEQRIKLIAGAFPGDSSAEPFSVEFVSVPNPIVSLSRDWGNNTLPYHGVEHNWLENDLQENLSSFDVYKLVLGATEQFQVTIKITPL